MRYTVLFFIFTMKDINWHIVNWSSGSNTNKLAYRARYISGQSIKSISHAERLYGVCKNLEKVLFELSRILYFHKSLPDMALLVRRREQRIPKVLTVVKDTPYY